MLHLCELHNVSKTSYYRMTAFQIALRATFGTLRPYRFVQSDIAASNNVSLTKAQDNTRRIMRTIHMGDHDFTRLLRDTLNLNLGNAAFNWCSSTALTTGQKGEDSFESHPFRIPKFLGLSFVEAPR